MVVLIVICIALIGLLVLAYFERREMREDYRKILNEFSIRTNGRTIFKPKPENQGKISEPAPERGEFAIMTPSMAEIDAIEKDDLAERNGEMSQEDLEFLTRTGVLR